MVHVHCAIIHCAIVQLCKCAIIHCAIVQASAPLSNIAVELLAKSNFLSAPQFIQPS